MTSNCSGELNIENLKPIADKFCFLAYVVNNSPCPSFIEKLRSHYSGVNNIEYDDKIYTFLKNLDSESDEYIANVLAVEWVKIFKGLSSNIGPKPPYAGVYMSAYGGNGLGVISDVKSVYCRYGFNGDETIFERADYLGCLLEFAGQSLYDAEGRNEAADIAAFTDKYVLSWLDSYIESADEFVETLFFKGFFEELLLFLKSVSAEFKK